MHVPFSLTLLLVHIGNGDKFYVCGFSILALKISLKPHVLFQKLSIGMHPLSHELVKLFLSGNGGFRIVSDGSIPLSIH